MFVPRVYYPHALVCDETLSLDKTMKHYLTNVIRLKSSEKLVLFNGKGGEYLATFHNDHLIVESFQPDQSLSPLNLHLGQAISRGDRMDYAIQKATELGVTTITPLITQKGLVKVEASRTDKRVQHWQNIAISAAEQCGRTTVPDILAPTALKDWVNLSFPGPSLLLDMSGQSIQALHHHNAFRFAIGPEGGWQKNEIDHMIQAGFQAINLGPRVLRTETAPIVALALLQGKFGDLSR